MTSPRILATTYMTGWRHGAEAREIDPWFSSQHDDAAIRKAYTDGYDAGYRARGAAGRIAEGVYGYKPTILRTAGEKKR